VAEAAHLLKFLLLRFDDWGTWSKWFDAAGVSSPVARGPLLNRASLLIDAAVDGQGVALARTTLAAWDLLNGRLVVPVDVSLSLQNTYWIVCPKVTSHGSKVATFREWLLAEAAGDARRLMTLVPPTVSERPYHFVGHS
jgi:LysR family glycine cleavage system transcriptional activator